MSKVDYSAIFDSVKNEAEGVIRMSLLKSAWEIALEKTKEIKADPEKIRQDALINEGRRLAGTYLTELEADGSQITKALKKASPDDEELLKKGLAATVVLNVALPQNTAFEERVNKMKHMAQMIDGPDSESSKLLGQIGEFMDKYLQARDTLLERARQQYQPMFEEKKEQMMQKYGKSIGISMDQDPEFIQFLQKNYSQLSSQYQQVLNQARDQLKAAWGIED